MEKENIDNVVDTSQVATDSQEEANPLVDKITIQELLKHPNADTLFIVSPYGDGVNWAIVKDGNFKVGQKAIWIDSVNDPLVPVSNPLFAHMASSAKADGYARVKAIKLRGFKSRGLIIPMDDEWESLSNSEIQAILKVKKWEDPTIYNHKGASIKNGISTSGPTNLLPTSKYDVDNLPKNWKFIKNGETVYLTEKIHGANGCYGWLNHRDSAEAEPTLGFHVRSRTLWKKEPGEDGKGDSLWWDAAKYHNLSEKLAPYPGIVVWGEVYGQVQDLKYGLDHAEFIVFDVWDSNAKRWYTWPEVVAFCNMIGVNHVPVVATMTWNTEKGIPKEIIELSEGQTLLNNAKHVREGIVLRWDGDMGQREVLKLVGTGYLMRKHQPE